MRFVLKLKGLLFLHVQRAWKYDPPHRKGDCQAESEHESIPRHLHTSPVQPRFEKKCWNKQTRSGRDSSCATPRTATPPSAPGACASWISLDSRSLSCACHAAA